MVGVEIELGPVALITSGPSSFPREMRIATPVITAATRSAARIGRSQPGRRLRTWCCHAVPTLAGDSGAGLPQAALEAVLLSRLDVRAAPGAVAAPAAGGHASCAATVPQLAQNLASAGSACPQLVHATSASPAGRPQFAQKC